MRRRPYLRHAIEVVKGREASGTVDLGTARRDRARAERRSSMVGGMVEGSRGQRVLGRHAGVAERESLSWMFGASMDEVSAEFGQSLV